MMKNILKKALVFASLLIIFPLITEAITLGEYEKKLKKYKSELQANQAEINMTDKEIRNTENRISTTENEISNLLKESEVIKYEIEENKKEISKLEEEAKKTIEYYQLNQSNNLYLDYIFDSHDISSFIYRFSVVEQFLEHNKKTSDDLVKKNKKQRKRQEDIKAIQKKLNNKKNELNQNALKLGDIRAELVKSGMSVEKQIQHYDKLVKEYKKLGCKSHHVIGVDCARDYDGGSFRRPMLKGYITGYLGDIATYGYFHYGVDFSSKNKSEPIYPVAGGTVIAKYKDRFGGRTVIMTHKINGKYYTSIYIHMRSYGPKVAVGRRLTTNDLIGRMGNSGWSTGAHLHLEIIPCRYMIDYQCRNWVAKDNYIKRLYNRGNYKGARTYIKFPDKGSSWYGR